MSFCKKETSLTLWVMNALIGGNLLQKRYNRTAYYFRLT